MRGEKGKKNSCRYLVQRGSEYRGSSKFHIHSIQVHQWLKISNNKVKLFPEKYFQLKTVIQSVYLHKFYITS